MGSLSPRDQMTFLSLGSTSAFRPGEQLVSEGQQATCVYLLVTGCAKVTGTTIDGNRVMLDIRVAGDLVGEFAALDGALRSATVTAATRLATRYIPQADFHRFLDSHPVAARAVSRSIAVKLRFTTSQRLDMGVALTEVRLARVLECLGDLHGAPSPEGLLIDVPLSQSEIADLVGVSQPNLQRAFAYLRRREVVITRYRQQVITNRQLLRRIADMRDDDVKEKADSNGHTRRQPDSR
jgi:CRP/FNR family cyclic AMP-dependent transcriptional regulator